MAGHGVLLYDLRSRNRYRAESLRLDDVRDCKTDPVELIIGLAVVVEVQRSGLVVNVFNDGVLEPYSGDNCAGKPWRPYPSPYVRLSI